MQNLTVIPGHYEGDEWTKDGYTLLIGHRRAAAAREAKLITVPCTVAHLLNRKEQVAIMLEENMQRTDLTIQEQAQGFQMMLDLGDTVEDVARKTGFSKQTVRHRIEIAKLDPAAIAAAEEEGFYQISISDYMKLEKLPTVEMRNAVLRDARDGRQLDYKVKTKLKEIEEEKKASAIAEKLKEIGVRKAPENVHSWSAGYENVTEISLDDFEKKIKPIENPKECVYSVGWGRIYILRKEKKEGRDAKQLSEFDLKTNYNNKRAKRIREIQKEMEAKRKSFCIRIANRDVMPAPEDHEKDILEKLMNILMTTDEWSSVSERMLLEYHAQKDWYSMSEEDRETERSIVRGMSVIAKMIIIVDRFFELRNGTGIEALIDHYGNIKEDRLKRLNMFYSEILQREYGYVPNEEEKEVLAGNHEVFTPWEEVREAVMSGKMKV